jgi:Xaa-Pro aminopeptidase
MAHAPTEWLCRRHQRVRAALAERSLEALVVTSLPNITYLTNFTGSAAILIVTSDRLLFLTDPRYVAEVAEMKRAGQAGPDLDLVAVESSYDSVLVGILATMPSARIGVEGAHLVVSRYHWLSERVRESSVSTQLVPTDGLVEAARVVKDAYEIDVLREAGRRLSAVAERSFGEVRAGRTEREIARAIDWLVRDGGFERSAFECIVASGPRAGLPHARPTERRLTEGDLVVLDFGGVHDSYCVDLTRTVVIGTASPRARQVYAAVRRAHDAAVAAVAPGQSRFAIDAAARSVLAEEGFAGAFGHGTGHGLGIEVHEAPRITRRRPDVDDGQEAVATGMVFTIEPGAYFEGWGGVRIEDDVLVTTDGVELLTDVATELLQL